MKDMSKIPDIYYIVWQPLFIHLIQDDSLYILSGVKLLYVFQNEKAA